MPPYFFLHFCSFCSRNERMAVLLHRSKIGGSVSSGAPVAWLASINLWLQMALYGMAKCALWFYKKLVAEQWEMGFVEENPFDPCVANKVVNWTQMTIRWHVDDLMISHLNQEDVLQVIQQMKDNYGGNLKGRMVGSVHAYLGITVEYLYSKELQINMWDYLRKVIQGLPEEITGVCATPASDYLFKVWHSITLNISFICCRQNKTW